MYFNVEERGKKHVRSMEILHCNNIYHDIIYGILYRAILFTVFSHYRKRLSLPSYYSNILK